MGANGRIAALEVLRARGRKAAWRGHGRANQYDAIVIGGGHNGLVAAAYLGKAGLRTLVLERRDTVGGAAGTSELAPGVRVPTLAHTVGRLAPVGRARPRPQAARLSLVGPDVRAFAPGLDGRRSSLWADPARTAEDCVAGRRTTPTLRGVRPARPLAGRLPRRPRRPRRRPTSSRPGSATRSPGSASGGRSAASAGATRRTLTRVLPMAVADFVAESFETDALQAAIAWRGIQYTAMGPWSAGTTAVLLADSAGNDGGAAGQTVFARGGPGALVAALAGAARAAGVEIRTGPRSSAITSHDGRATGVVLADGDELDRPGRRRRASTRSRR